MNRVVITGMGAVSPYGLGVPALHQGLGEGNSAVRNLKEEWGQYLPNLSCWVGAPLPCDLDPKVIPRKYRRSMGRTAMLAAVAAMEAVEEAALNPEQLNSTRTGIFFASSTGSAQVMIEFFTSFIKDRDVSHLQSGTFFKVMSHTCAANLAHLFRARGRIVSPDCACASSSMAIGLAYESIRAGQQDMILCGGSDELSVVTSATFESVTAISYHYNDSPESTPRPFDAVRDGTVCGEGAGCMVLESLKSAQSRSAPILGEILGFATNSDGEYLSQAQSDSLVRCILDAIDSASLRAEDIDYINAHATGTVIGDRAEAEAILKVFPNGSVPISSLKAHIGHTLGASGVLESIGVLKGLESGVLYPSRNLETVEHDFENLQFLRTRQTSEANTFLKNSFAFGGVNTALVYRRDFH